MLVLAVDVYWQVCLDDGETQVLPVSMSRFRALRLLIITDRLK